MVRRNFLRNIKTIIGLGAIAPLLDECTPAAVSPKPTANFTIDITNPAYSSLNVVGGVVSVQGIFIVRTGQSAYIGLSPICTHAGCTVNFSSSAKQFVCPCHNGVYDVNGKVVSGPPPAALAQYAATLNGNILTVTS